jgi:hypothetical protein
MYINERKLLICLDCGDLDLLYTVFNFSIEVHFAMFILTAYLCVEIPDCGDRDLLYLISVYKYILPCLF